MTTPTPGVPPCPICSAPRVPMALNRWRCSAVELGTEHGRASMLIPPLEVKRSVHQRVIAEGRVKEAAAEEAEAHALYLEAWRAYEEAEAKTAAVRAELATAQAEELAAWRAAYPAEMTR